MKFDSQQKAGIKKELASCLQGEPEILKIVVFGSFITADSPHDLDVAIYQNSNESYLPLALKYRRKTRSVARKIPLDIFPLRPGISGNSMLAEIDNGEVIYER